MARYWRAGESFAQHERQALLHLYEKVCGAGRPTAGEGVKSKSLVVAVVVVSLRKGASTCYATTSRRDTVTDRILPLSPVVVGHHFFN